jgi:hypothetical protein
MKSLLRRFAIAVLLSFSCAAGTLFWYSKTQEKKQTTATVIVAQAAQVNNEVLRRAPTRLLWENITTGDDLFDGETIRTSENGELHIRFDDGRSIELEPESLVVLQKSERAISLDLLEGSLFVDAKQATEGADALLLKAENKSVDLSGAKASLSRGANNRLDVEVLEGSAKIKDSSGYAREVKRGEQSSLGAPQISAARIEVLSPSTTKAVYLHSSQQNKLNFRWKGLDPTWKVEILAGATRRQMKLVAENDLAQPNSAVGEIPYGKTWWTLVARKRDTGTVMHESPVYRLDLRGKPAAGLLSPENDTVVGVEKAPSGVEFKWTRPAGAQRVELKVSQEPIFSSPVFVKSLSEGENVKSSQLEEGVYFARLATYYPELSEPEIGPLIKFSVRTRAVVEETPAPIAWTVPEARRIQPYGIVPQLELSWKAEGRSEEIIGYRLRLKRMTSDPEDEPVRLVLQDSTSKTPLIHGGRYLASVEAIDKYEHIIGRSDVLEVAATEAPLLEAPSIMPKEGPLHSGFDGRMELKWSPVIGAMEYQLVVKNKSGREVLNKRLSVTTQSLQNLMPGQYSVTLQALDQWGRLSQPGSERTLSVPSKSGLKAPTLKRIKVD